MVDRGDGKKSNTYGPPGSRHHVNQGLKQQQQQESIQEKKKWIRKIIGRNIVQ